MAYLLDTDVIINQLRGKEFIKKAYTDSAKISIITLGELLYGAHKSPSYEKTQKLMHEFLHDFEIEVLNLDEDTIRVFAQIKSSLERKGERLEDFDLLIAAAALRHSLPLITKNLRHFKRIPGLRTA